MLQNFYANLNIDGKGGVAAVKFFFRENMKKKQ